MSPSLLTCRMLVVVALFVGAWSPQVMAQSDAAARELRAATRALEDASYQSAARHARALVGLTTQAAERAEGYLILGLALFFSGDSAGAREAFLELLRLDPDARLDPALVPPEAIAVFEDVRARHAAELEALRPKPPRYILLSTLPAVGQFYNGEPVKGWIVASSGVLLLAANVTSYFVLRSWCDPNNKTCSSGSGRDRTSTARTLRAVNTLSGTALIGLTVFSVVDGYLGYRRGTSRERAISVAVTPSAGGAAIQARWSF